MLLDLFSLSVGGFIGVVMGYITCALMVVAKQSDQMPNVYCNIDNCNKSCPGWTKCDAKWADKHGV